MAWRNEPKIRDLEPYAKKHGLRYVVLFGVHADGSKYDVTTYGINRLHCDVAAIAGKQLQEIIKDGEWPNWEGVPRPPQNARPTIVCLCGSTRFVAAFDAANLRLTLEGKIVLTIGCNTKSDDQLGITPDEKRKLAELHLRKIDLADEVLVLTVNGYIGESTANEIAYAERTGKPVSYWE